MKKILLDKNYHYVEENKRAFLISFDENMCTLGYERIGIGDFTRWGNYTIGIADLKN